MLKAKILSGVNLLGGNMNDIFLSLLKQLIILASNLFYFSVQNQQRPEMRPSNRNQGQGQNRSSRVAGYEVIEEDEM